MLEKHHKHVSYEKKNYFIIGHLSVGSKGIAQNFNTAIFGNTGFPVAFEQSPDYPWVVSEGCVSSSNIVGLKTSWFSTTVDIVEASGSVKFDYKVDIAGYGEKFYLIRILST